MKSQGFSFFGSRAFRISARVLFGFRLARFSGTFFYEIIFSDSNIQKTFLHTRFYMDAFQNEARNAKSIRRSLPDLRIFSNIFLYLINCDVNIIHIPTGSPFLCVSGWVYRITLCGQKKGPGTFCARESTDEERMNAQPTRVIRFRYSGHHGEELC